MADRFSTCPTHMVMKPCPHCEPSKYMPVEIEVCGDVFSGEQLIPCAEPGCGKLRSKWRAHDYRRMARTFDY